MQVLAIDFARHLEEGSLRSRLEQLNEVIADILAKEYKPLNNTHANTIYYIVGAMLSVIHKTFAPLSRYDKDGTNCPYLRSFGIC